jgi:hypothetical protein
MVTIDEQIITIVIVIICYYNSGYLLINSNYLLINSDHLLLNITQIWDSGGIINYCEILLFKKVILQKSSLRVKKKKKADNITVSQSLKSQPTSGIVRYY